MIRRATVVAVGRLKGWAAEGCEDYLGRLRRYFPVEVAEIPEEDMNRRLASDVLATEGERLLKRIPAGSHVMALDREKGEPLRLRQLSREPGLEHVPGRRSRIKREHSRTVVLDPVHLRAHICNVSSQLVSRSAHRLEKAACQQRSRSERTPCAKQTTGEGRRSASCQPSLAQAEKLIS